jgi:predicted RNA-binding protein YlqC (UPF0109 family)
MKKISPLDIDRFIRRLVAGFTTHPDALGIDTEVAGGCISVQFRPAAEDTGALIGTGGKMHKSFQAVLTALAARGGLKLHLAPVVEPHDKRKMASEEHKLTVDEIGQLFSITCDELFEKPFGWAWDTDERRSNINLMISKNEARNVTDAELGEGLSRIFNAIGHKSGIKIYVLLERSKT